MGNKSIPGTTSFTPLPPLSWSKCCKRDKAIRREWWNSWEGCKGEEEEGEVDTGSWSPTGYKEGSRATADCCQSTTNKAGSWNSKLECQETQGKVWEMHEIQCTRFTHGFSTCLFDRPAWGIFSGSFPLVGLQHGQFKWLPKSGAMNKLSKVQWHTVVKEGGRSRTCPEHS